MAILLQRLEADIDLLLRRRKSTRERLVLSGTTSFSVFYTESVEWTSAIENDFIVVPWLKMNLALTGGH